MVHDLTDSSRATVTVDRDGWVHAISPALLQFTGRSIEQAEEINFVDLVHPDDAPAVRALLDELASAGSTSLASIRLFTVGDHWSPIRLSGHGVGDQRMVLDCLVDEDTGQELDQPDHGSGTTVEPPTVGVARDENPNDDVAARRAAIRLRADGGAAAMVEIDQQGRTIFVSGPWESLGVDDLGEAAAFDRFCLRSGVGDQISAAISEIIDNSGSGSGSDTDSARGSSVADGHRTIRIGPAIDHPATHWVHVVAIPSPRRAGVDHALVAVTEQSELAPTAVAASASSPTIERTELAPTVVHTASTDNHQLRTETGTPAGGSSAGADRSGGNGRADSSRTVRASIAARLAPIGAWLQRRDVTLAQGIAAAAVVLFALVLRTWDLAGVPTGLHGDEAITGQEAQRILDHGSIGVYTGSALGQPTAPFYLHAVAVGLFGPTVWAVRIVAALAGTITVGATYLVVQRRLGHPIAIASALAMATMTWTLHFSRIGFGVAWWPLVTLVAVAAIDKATKDQTAMAWLRAGGAAIFGVYVYNSHWIFGLAVAIFMTTWFLWRHQRPVNRTVPWVGVLGALVVGWPMISYALDDTNQYSNHFDHVSRRTLPEWTDEGFFGKVARFTEWYVDAWDVLLLSPTSDGVDGSGVIGQVPLIFTVLGVVGAIHVLRHHRSAFFGLVFTTLLVLPIGPALTFDASTRRDVAMAPMIAILAGVGAVWLVTAVASRTTVTAGRVTAMALVALTLATSVVPYFTAFRNSGEQKWVFAQELTVAADAVLTAAEDGPVFVNWFSARHYYDYPTLAFLLGDIPGANRAPLDLGYIEDPALELADGVVGDQVYVFVGDYGENLDPLRSLYPDGQVILRSDDPRVVGYEVSTP